MIYTEDALLRIENLSLEIIRGKKNAVRVVDDVSLNIKSGEFVALAGESGCGKTLTALSVLNLLPENIIVSGGSILFSGKERAMIFQDPTSSLDPLMLVGRQVAEAVLVRGFDKEDAERLAKKNMAAAGLKDLDRIYNSYPHELSGGQKQRILIALSLMNKPELLIADEPTSSLDVTVQKEILETISALNRRHGTSMLLITHDLSVVKKYCSRLYIMYAGRIVESGPVSEVLRNPAHPYTKALIDAIPSFSKQRLSTVSGYVPSPYMRKENACGFYERCPLAEKICLGQKPLLKENDGRAVRCFFAEEK